MTRIYLEPGTAEIETGGDRGLDPDAVRALAYLTEAGHEIVLVVPEGVEPPADLRSLGASSVEAPPEKPDRPAWFLTTDVSHCVGRSAKMRTVLIGAAPNHGSVMRCDAVARDVQAAVLEILASEAMPSS